MTRAERKSLNKRAHALRRQATDTDYREARAAGQAITWREVWDTYASLENADVLEHLAPAVTVTPAATKTRRAHKAPAHIAAMTVEYRAARAAWQAGLDEAMRGARANGRPARGERYTDEERDYRAANPAPVWSDWLADMSARAVAGQDVAA